MTAPCIYTYLCLPALVGHVIRRFADNLVTKNRLTKGKKNKKNQKVNCAGSMIRKHYITFAICIILGSLLSPCIADTPLPVLKLPNGFGVNIHFRGEPQDLDLIVDAGFKFIRMDLTWEAIERKRGIYEFEKSGYDALTQGCTKRGIRILYILDYSNRLYESERSVRTDEGRRAFASFAEAAAKRYSGMKILWEIWNEPNIKLFWRPQPSVDDYCKLVKATAGKIKNADKTGLVVAPATSTIPFKWLEDCFKKGLLKWIDVLSVHPYRPQPPETVVKDYKKLRELIKSNAPNGKKIPVISGEWGYSNINWDNTRLSNEQQACYLVRELLVNLHQEIPVSIWYDWKNDGTNPDEREHHFGTVTYDLKPKTAYLAVKVLSSTLAGYTVDRMHELEEDKDFALILRKGRRTATVAWTMGEDHQIILNIPSGKATLIDLLGKQKETSWPSDALELTISQRPQYIIIHRD